MAFQGQNALMLAHLAQGADDLFFQFLHHSHGDIEEVAGAAGGIQHAHLAQLFVEATDQTTRTQGITVQIQADGLGFDRLPIRAQRLHDRRLDQALHKGARRVVGAQFGAFRWIKRLLQQGAEDRRLDIGPIASRRCDQRRQLVFCDRDRVHAVIKPAVEPPDTLLRRQAVPAFIHRPEEYPGGIVKSLGLGAIAFQQPQESPVVDQPNAVGEHGEDALHDEQRRLFGLSRSVHPVQPNLPSVVDRSHQPGQPRRDGRGHLGRLGGRVQRHGLCPDPAQAVPHLGRAKLIQRDPIACTVGERRVDLALTREVGPKLDRSPDVHDHQKRGPFIQRLGVVLGLSLGRSHQPIQRVLRRRT